MSKFLKLSDYNDLIKSKLVTESYNEKLNLVTIKYKRKVFYDNLWNKDPLLLEARGHTFDGTTGELVALPFHKIFNYGENGTDFKNSTYFYAVEKVNGSMGCVSFHEKKGFIFSTTGSSNKETSEFVSRLEKLFWYTVNDLKFIENILKDSSLLFEVVSDEDPHIIKENSGLYLIGMRNHKDGSYIPENTLDYISRLCGFLRPKIHKNLTKEKILSMVETEDIEGYIIHEYFDDMCVDGMIKGNPCFKIKCKKYLSHKFLSRISSDSKFNQLWKNGTGEEETNSILNALKLKYNTPKEFLVLKEQERLNVIRGIDLKW